MKLSEAIRTLKDAGIENAAGEAREIFSTLGKIPFCDTVGRDAETNEPRAINAVLERAKRVPLQYLLGKVYFYKESYEVSPDCLIPRQDTEILVDYAVKNLPRGAHFADLCTGSGCVAVSVLKNTTDTTCVAVDISAGAVELARKNARQNGVESRLRLLTLDLMQDSIDGELFAVLSNPPYVTNDEYAALEPELYFEPRAAFVGGDDGADFYRRFTEIYKSKIACDGFIAYEIGAGQADLIKEIAKENGMGCEIINDLSHLPRVAVLKNNK